MVCGWIISPLADSTGFYQIISGLRIDFYSVTVEYDGINTTLSDVLVGEGRIRNIDIEIDLPPSGLLIGRVTDAVYGDFVEGAMVQATCSGSIETTTDPKGCFSFYLDLGNYTISVTAPGYTANVTTEMFSVELNEVTRIYYDVAQVPGFLIETITGSDSATVLGTCFGDANPIPEFPVIAIPAVFAVTILMVLYASQKTRKYKIEKILR